MTRLLISLLVAGAIVAQNPETPSYPGGVPSFAVLNQSAQTTLATSIDASATSIILNDAARFVAPVIITIGTEKISCTTRTVNTLSVCTRGYNVGNGATTAAEHTSGEAVYGYIESKLINQQSAEIVAIATYAVPNTRTVNGHALSANVTVTKGDVGLGNVDNTADSAKPISTATQTALDGKLGQVPQFTGGDATTPSSGSVAIAVGRVNGVSYGSSPALHSSPVVTATNATTYKEIPECAKGLTFAQSTDTYGCMPAAGPITDGYFSASDYAAFAAAIASKSPIDNPEFTTAATAPKFVTNDATHTGKDEMKPGTGTNFAEAIAAGNFALYFNSANSNHLTKRDSSGTDVDLEAAANGMVYPGAGIPNSTGSAWGTSYTVGAAANNIPQLDSGGKLPAADMPAPGATTLGGVKSGQCTTTTGKLMGYDTNGDRICETDQGGAQGTGDVVASGDNTFTGANTFSAGRIIPPQATFASPPSSPVTGQEFTFTDASAAGTCAGSGTAIAKCRWSGSAWQAVGDGGGGTSVSADGWYLNIGGTKYLLPTMAAATPFVTTGFANTFRTFTVASVGSATELTTDGSTSTHLYSHAYDFGTSKDIIIAFAPDLIKLVTAGLNSQYGVALHESGTGKSIGYTIYMDGSSPYGTRLSVDKYDNASGYAWRSSIVAPNHFPVSAGNPIWLKINTGTTTITFSYSVNGGRTWYTFGTAAKATYFTTAPDSAGIIVSIGSAVVRSVNVLSWSVQ